MQENPLLLSLLASLCLGAFVFSLILLAGPAWLWYARRRLADLTPRLQDLGISTDQLPLYMMLWGLAMLGTALLLGVTLGMYLIAAVAVVLIYLLPRLLLQVQLEKRQSLLRDQMVGACVALANTARAGLWIGQGLAEVARETPAPLSGELRRIVHEFQRGRPLAESIDDARRRLNLESFTLFANTILVALERGGDFTKSLEKISLSLQENQRLERKIEADTASGRRVVVTLAIFPFAFMAVFYLLDREGTSLLFNSFVGQAVFVLVVVLVSLSVRWSQKILDLRV